MNKWLSLLTMLLLSFSSIAQLQISNIDYFQKNIDQPKKGFIPIGDEEYFIEQGWYETKISLIKENELELLHVIDARPDRNYDAGRGDYTYSNSGLRYEGNMLYELYPSHIYTINILSGQVEQIIDLSSYNLGVIYDFIITPDHYFLFALREGRNAYFAYDRQEEVLETVAFSENRLLFRIGTHLYYNDLTTAQLIAHDMASEVTDTLISSVTGPLIVKPLTANGEQQLLVAEGDSSALYLIDSDHSISTVDCITANIPEDIYFMSDLVLYTKAYGDEDSVFVIDRHDCTLLSSYALAKDIAVRDSRELFDEYVLWSNTSNWLGDAKFILYDVAEKTFTPIDLQADFPYTDQAVRYEDKLYMVLYDDIHHYGIRPQIVGLDLTTKLVQYLDDYEKEYVYTIAIGERQQDGEFHIYYNTQEEAMLRNYSHHDQDWRPVHEFDYAKNVGISPRILARAWYNDQLFFYCSDGIYVLENDQVTKLLGASAPGEGFSASGLMVKDGRVHALIIQGTTAYKITINPNNLSVQQQLIPNLSALDYRRPVTEYAILNIPNGYSAENTGYYSLRDEEFKSFQYNGATIDAFAYTLSGNNVLFRTLQNNRRWVIFNTATETAILTEIPNNAYPKVYPDGEGGFFLTYRSSISTLDDLTHLNANGQLTTIEEEFDHIVFYGGERLDGAITSIAFDGDGEMIIFSAKDGEYHLTRIPDGSLVYYQSHSYFWKENDDMSIVEVPNGDQYDTYIFRFGEQPKKINSNERIIQLEEAWIEEDKAILLYVDRGAQSLSFIDYDFATETLIPRQSINIKFNAFSIETSRCGGNNYMLALNDGLHGEEPWLYNSATGSLRLLTDQITGFEGSFPGAYFPAPNGEDFYFLMFSRRHNRQLFKLDQTTVATAAPEALPIAPLIVSPSPTTGTIRLNQDLKELRLYDLHGRLVYGARAYVQQTPLQVGFVPDGVYVAVGINEMGVVVRERFVVCGE
ncbi:MAG: hypothetical protein AAGG75_15225 [Bacteroidota bacterium]